MRNFFLSISILSALLVTSTAIAQTTFPKEEGDKARYTVQIDFQKAYISGIGLMVCQDNAIVGSVFNEFGVSMLAFTYNPVKNKVKIINVVGNLNKWYIRRVLKKDLRMMMGVLRESGTTYVDEKYHITYTFTPLANSDDTEE